MPKQLNANHPLTTPIAKINKTISENSAQSFVFSLLLSFFAFIFFKNILVNIEIEIKCRIISYLHINAFVINKYLSLNTHIPNISAT